MCAAQGLEEQLLAELVRAERPELEESRDSLTTSISADKKQLQVREEMSPGLPAPCNCWHGGGVVCRLASVQELHSRFRVLA